jgi:hypothetical protein
MYSNTINLSIGALLILLLSACGKSATENPLKGIKHGIWIPANNNISEISRRPKDAPDSIIFFTPPLLVINNEFEISTWNGFFFTHKVKMNKKDKNWYLGVYDCQITSTKDTLMCIYTDAYNRKIRIPYIYIIEKSISPPITDIFVSIDSTIWGNTSALSTMPDSFMFLADLKMMTGRSFKTISMKWREYLPEYKFDTGEYALLILHTDDSLSIVQFKWETYVLKRINPQIDSIELISLNRTNNRNEIVVLKKFKTPQKME